MKKESYDKLSRKIALTMITVSMTPLILVGGLIFVEFRSIYDAKVYAHLAEVVDKHKDNIDAFLNDKLHEVQYLNEAYSYEQLTSPDFLEKTLRGIQHQYGRIFVDIGIVDPDGRQVAYAGPFNLLNADYSKAGWFKNSRNKQTDISDVFLGLRKTPHFIIAASSSSNGKQWTLRATIDFLAFSNMVENIRIGETGYAYILNNAGEFQTTPPATRHRTLTQNPKNVTPHQSMVAGVTILDSEGSNGEAYITVSSALKNGDWELVYQQSRSDAFSAMYRSELYTLLIFLLGGLGIVVMAVFISRKIIDRFKTIDRETQLINKQMVETGKLASIGELASGIAHEINNPVAIMIEEAGWVGDLLYDEGHDLASRSEIERALQQVRTQGQRCRDITHKLLSFARQTDSNVTKVSLPELIEEVVNLSMQQARYAQVTFSLNIADDLPPIDASTTELQQVFLNLINNSIQAMEQEGGELTISCQPDGEKVLISIADTGRGIPAVNLRRIFDPFFTTKPVGKGTGLGLSICFGIIHQMDGEIDVESTVGKGTRFNIRLPLPALEMNQDKHREIHP